jgi:hypothetical protein
MPLPGGLPPVGDQTARNLGSLGRHHIPAANARMENSSMSGTQELTIDVPSNEWLTEKEAA